MLGPPLRVLTVRTGYVCMVPAEVGAALSTFRVSFLTNTPSTVSVHSTTPRCGPAVAHHILQRTRADVLGYRVHPCSGSSRAAGPWVADDCSHAFSCLYEGTSLRMEHLHMCVCACVHGTCCVTFPDSVSVPLPLCLRANIWLEKRTFWPGEVLACTLKELTQLSLSFAWD